MGPQKIALEMKSAKEKACRILSRLCTFHVRFLRCCLKKLCSYITWFENVVLLLGVAPWHLNVLFLTSIPSDVKISLISSEEIDEAMEVVNSKLE